ncbi:MAG: hypothetical protein J7K21_06900 [Desulfurococcales archaeon]|nr:hypothetical protein [Desulfurococcales archaeon]
MPKVPRIDYYDLVDLLIEDLDTEEFVVAHYLVGIPRNLDPDTVARVIALEQSTGTWIRVPAETPEMRRRHAAKVIGLYEIPDYEFEIPEDVKIRRFILSVAYPWRNFGFNISTMLSTVIGNIASAGRLKLLDLWFPKRFLKGFKGPRYGIDGLRRYIGVYDRPLIVAMIKPDIYSPPKLGAELAYQAWSGGVDIIKDDELLTDPEFNRVEERLPLFLEAADKAKEETGEKKLYTVNITTDPPRIFELAERVKELGGNALMINYPTVGLGVLKKVAEDDSINLPILAHSDFSGAIYESPETGVSSILILGKLVRLAGGDMVIYSAPYGKQPYFIREKYLRVAKYLRAPMANIKPMLPIPSGGITQLHIPQLIKDLGVDIGIGAGGAIHAHPMGSKAGAKAFRQAIDATLKGIPLEEYAKDHPELKVVVEAWKKGVLKIMLGGGP